MIARKKTHGNQEHDEDGGGRQCATAFSYPGQCVSAPTDLFAQGEGRAGRRQEPKGYLSGVPSHRLGGLL
jgi:hypothetical protein